MRQNRLFFAGNIAEIYATIGEKDLAFSWLQTAYAQHSLAIASADVGLQHLHREFRLDALRSDPRFTALLRRVGLPQ